MSAANVRKPTKLRLDNAHVIEYVGGPQPYLWIGSRDGGEFYDSIDVKKLRAFLRGRRG